MTIPIILAVGAVGVVLLLVWGPVSAAGGGARLEDECRGLRTSLELSRTQGGDASALERLEIQYADCRRKLREAGVVTDEAGDQLAVIAATLQQMSSEWAHLRATDYADILKRGHTRGTILRLGQRLPALYRAAVDAAGTDVDALRALSNSASSAVGESHARMACYTAESPGCGRYLGSVEDDAAAKVRQERELVTIPLTAARAEVLEALKLAAGPTIGEQRQDAARRLLEEDSAKERGEGDLTAAQVLARLFAGVGRDG